MTAGQPTWIEEARALPLAFAQVREDPAIDQVVVHRIAGGARIVMVASGGCTAAALASSPNVESIVLVDPNAAQIALARLKLHLLATADPGERMALLGHAAMPALDRAKALTRQLATLGLAGDAS